MRERFDALVVGGGPGGGLAALLLARQGRRVMLVERGARNRAKTCGHCLSAAGVNVLRQAGLGEELDAIACAPSTSLHIHLPRQSPLALSLDGHAGLVVARSKLDQLIMDAAAAAGAVIRQPANAVPQHASVRVRDARGDREIEARLVIGADGLRSEVARAGGLAAPNPPGRKYGFSFTIPFTVDHDIGAGEIHMFIIPGGYLGAARQRDALHLAALVDASGVHERSPASFIRRVVEAFPHLNGLDPGRCAADMLALMNAAGPIPCLARDVATARLALVGDAAGYIEPFTGEGMGWALLSAAMCAAASAQCGTEVWSEQAAGAYRRAWRAAIGREQRRCRALSWALERPKLLRAMLAARPAARMIASRLARRVAAA